MGDDRVHNALAQWLPAFLDGERGPREVYADHPVTWHAATDTETPIDPEDDNPSFARLREVVPDVHHEDTKVEVFDGGWVVQTVTVGTIDGERVRVPACLVVRLDDAGRIARFEEYADTASAAPFIRALRG